MTEIQCKLSQYYLYFNATDTVMTLSDMIKYIRLSSSWTKLWSET